MSRTKGKTNTVRKLQGRDDDPSIMLVEHPWQVLSTLHVQYLLGSLLGSGRIRYLSSGGGVVIDAVVEVIWHELHVPYIE